MEEEPSLESKFIKLTENHDSLKYFYLYKFYNKFNEDSNVDVHKQECQGFVQAYEYSGGDTLFDLCGKLRKNFKNFTETEKVVGKKNACEYLKFWFNDQIITYSYNYDTIYPIVDNWATIIGDSEIYNICNEEDILRGSFNDDMIRNNSNAFYVMKVIYEYLKGAKVINTTIENINEIRNDVKDSYIEDNFHEYEKIKNKCSSNSTNSLLCNIYKDCVSRYTNELSQLENKLSKHLAVHQVRERWYTDLEELKKLKEVALASSDGDNELTTSSLRAIITSICTILCLGLTLISLYKFTPLGSLFHPKTQKRKRTFKNIEEENGNSMFSNNKYNQSYSTNKKYNLRYHSA